MDLSQVAAVHNFLEKSAQQDPDKIALVLDDQRISYRQINEMANRLAAWLLEQGVVTGDRIVLLLENGIEYIVSYYAVLKSGAVAAPLNSDLKADSLAAVLGELQPRGVIAGCKSEELLLAVDPPGLGIPFMVIKSPVRPGAPAGAKWSPGTKSCMTERPQIPRSRPPPRLWPASFTLRGRRENPKG